MWFWAVGSGADTKVLNGGIQGLPFHRWGLCLLEGWESRTLPTLSWETMWDEASYIVCVYGLKAPFIILFWKIEEPFNSYLKKYL